MEKQGSLGAMEFSIDWGDEEVRLEEPRVA
jgi:hypothetical protein